MKLSNLRRTNTWLVLPVILGAMLLTMLFAASAWAADRTMDRVGSTQKWTDTGLPSNIPLENTTAIITNSLFLPMIHGDPPKAADDAYSTDEDVTLNVPAPGVLANDNVNHNEHLSAVLVGGPKKGDVTLTSDGAFNYIPHEDFYGTDIFSYLVTNEYVQTNVAEVIITIDPVADTPVAEDDKYETNEDETLTVITPGVLWNDTDADGDQMKASIITSTTKGNLQLEQDGSFVYDPNPNFNGTDSFIYSTSDGKGNSDEATVTITIKPVDDDTALDLLGVWTSDILSHFQPAFPPTTEMIYNSSGRANLEVPISADIRLVQNGPCDSGVIYSETLSLDPGEWQHEATSISGDCAGVYTTTTQLKYNHNGTFTPTLTTRHVVNYPSQIILSEGQGFDKCFIPTLEQMQAWWDKSPYSVFNLYIGGISFYCDHQPMDATWVHRTAEQGWSFILTWVGPQAPCTSFKHRISWNPEAAHIQGELEALYAADAAQKLGFLGDQVIYYDMEGYSNQPSSCSKAVDAFMQGWVDGLHDLGLKAGGYGSPCRSYISTWADNQPPPDDVWLAHWHSSFYDPDATVWDAPCLSNSLWPEHQRIKQYTGGHTETWGGESLTIDSNVLDGAITSIPMTTTLASTAPSANPVVMSISGPKITAAGLKDTESGWALVDDRLVFTLDGGQSWEDITPTSYHPVEAAWDENGGLWLVAVGSDSADGLQVGRSLDDGLSWEFSPLVTGEKGWDIPIESVHMDVLDQNSAWVSLELASGSSFSLGRLFATQDGGRTWQARDLPAGGSVEFLDAQRGWLAGGPIGDRLYATQDGGITWQLQQLNLPEGARAEMGLPSLSSQGRIVLPVVLEGPDGEQLAVYSSSAESQSWRLDQVGPLEGDMSPNSFLQSSPEPLINGYTHPLPGGEVIEVVFVDDLHGWVIVQEGDCQGEKRGWSQDPLLCEQHWSLQATQDGGLTWGDISPR